MRLFVLILAIVLTACRPSPAPSSSSGSPLAVNASTASMQRVPRTFEAGGVVRAKITATLASRIIAPVLAVHVAAGDHVRAGQALVVFDGRDLEANRARAAAEVLALERAHTAAIADRTAAQAALTLARTTSGRMTNLYAHDAATAQQADEATSALHVAEARLQAAEAQAASTDASLEGARQAEASARATASYATLVAPFDGLITERLADPGALATPGAPLLRIDDPRRFRLEVVIDESRLTSITERTTAQVLLDSDDGGENATATLNGTVSEISRAVDAGSHSFMVKIDLPSTATLRSGMFGRARFATGSEEMLTISPAAIVPRGQLSTIYVVSSGNRAQMRVIDTGARGADWVEVLAGVSAGERVILSPAGVADGVAVKDVDPEVRR